MEQKSKSSITENSQQAEEKNSKLSFENLVLGYRIVVISGVLFMISLFLSWASVGGWLFENGLAFMGFYIDRGTNLPNFHYLTLITAILCIGLCLPFFKKRNDEKYKAFPNIMVVVSIIGLLPYFLFPFELKGCDPDCQVEFGGWLSILATLGMLIGAILAWREMKRGKE